MKIRYISEEQQKKLLNIDLCVDSIKKMYDVMDKGEYQMGNKGEDSHGQISYYPRKNSTKPNIYIAMSGYLGAYYNVAGMKWHGPNLKGSGFAETTHTLIINELDTGYPIGILPANLITTYRTSCNLLYSLSLIDRKNFETVGIIGPGKINSLFLEGIIKRYSTVKNVKVKGRGKKSLNSFIEYFSKKFKYINIQSVESFEEAVVDSDIISINTGFEYESIADMPIIKKNWLKNTAVIICPSFASFSEKFLINDCIKIADNYRMYESYLSKLGYPVYKKMSTLGNKFVDMVYEKKISSEDIVDIFDILHGEKKDILSQDKPILLASGGMIVQDIAVGYELIKKANRENIGSLLEF